MSRGPPPAIGAAAKQADGSEGPHTPRKSQPKRGSVDPFAQAIVEHRAQRKAWDHPAVGQDIEDGLQRTPI
jgi:hypothetical protein